MELIVLILSAFITSAISAVLGMGGGIILLGKDFLNPWGKIAPNASHVTINSDATVVLPLLIKGLLTSL